jgi:hypothetical protein
VKIYCSHSNKVFNRASNFYQCNICTLGWYASDITPMVILGCTDMTEVDPEYYDKLEAKALLNKKFIRCPICKDTIEKRRHLLCQLKQVLKKFGL